MGLRDQPALHRTVLRAGRDAIERHDLPLLQVGMMIVTAIYALANFVAELLYAVLNPRIRVAGAAA